MAKRDRVDDGPLPDAKRVRREQATGADILHAHRRDEAANQSIQILFLGPGFCGKTWAAINHVTVEHKKIPFDRLLVVSPVLKLEQRHISTLLALNIPYVELHEELTEAVCKKIWSDVKHGERPLPRTLLFIDNCDHEPIIKKRNSEFLHITAEGHHLGISVVMVAQDIKCVDEATLLNSHAIAFYPYDSDEATYRAIARACIGSNHASAVKRLRALMKAAQRIAPACPFLGIMHNVNHHGGTNTFYAGFGARIDEDSA